MPITLSKIQYEPRSIAHFEALEQTCRLHQLSGSGDKYFFSASAFDQGYSMCYAGTAVQLIVDLYLGRGFERKGARVLGQNIIVVPNQH